jgi:hypothetical protein
MTIYRDALFDILEAKTLTLAHEIATEVLELEDLEDEEDSEDDDEDCVDIKDILSEFK